MSYILILFNICIFDTFYLYLLRFNIVFDDIFRKNDKAHCTTKWGRTPLFFYSFSRPCDYARWFSPEDNMETLFDWMSSMAGQTAQRHHVLDLFGASRAIASAWTHSGYSSAGYDIQFGSHNDICSESGFRTLVQLGMELLGYECVISIHHVVLVGGALFLHGLVACNMILHVLLRCNIPIKSIIIQYIPHQPAWEAVTKSHKGLWTMPWSWQRHLAVYMFLHRFLCTEDVTPAQRVTQAGSK